MLELKQIVKDYVSGGEVVHALKGVDLRFRTSEFVSILGPSGCGKTTLLNIIGGLDQYTSGDLVIDGVSTKDYKDRDWDTYRNHSIGFVFQTYNLIPHQTVLKNVELALTLAGVPKSERRPRAVQALELVGLGDKINKRPNQLSGGQMQRVAIARALVNNPTIILADEPTGALDTETGIQVMEILKDVAKDRLVVMVTHNPELAEQYSSRIIRILDGEIVGDTAPLSEEEYAKEKAAELTANEQWDTETTQTTAKNSGKKHKRKKKSSMSLWTAFKLSLNNLFTKKGRTILTSFAGSIGIIGIALILSVSQGMTAYINQVQEQTLTTYPLTIQASAMDLSSLVAGMMGDRDKPNDRTDPDRVYQRSVVEHVAKIVDATSGATNDLKRFKEKLIEPALRGENQKLHDAIAGVQYQYNLDLHIYGKSAEDKIREIDPREMLIKVIGSQLGSGAQAAMGGYYASMTTFTVNLFQEILPDVDGSPVNKLLYDQYDLVYGSWPNSYDEVVLIMNENNEISDIALYALGILGDDYIDSIVSSFDDDANGNEYTKPDNWSYKDICDTDCVVILNSSCYELVDGEWTDLRETEYTLNMLYNNGLKLNITGIIRPNPDATAHMLSGTIGYTADLVEYVVKQSEQSAVYKAQLASPDTDIFTGLPFGESADNMTEAEKATAFNEYFDGLELAGKMDAYAEMLCIDNPEEIAQNAEATLQYLQKDGPDKFRENVAGMMSMMPGMSSIPTEIIMGYLANMTDDEIADLIRPALVENARMSYKAVRLREISQDSDPTTTINEYLQGRSEEQLAAYYDEIVEFSSATYEDNMTKIGWVDLDNPSAINIYASSFDAKDVIAAEIERYNNEAEDDSQKITYTDFVALVMSAVTTIIDAVTYVLIAFVAISLIVSSIMIGVITLISVQERTKEIGILRAIGASKRDVSSMFNAETVIIGFAAGLIGVLVTYLLCIPINSILQFFTGIANLKAYLPPLAALVLVLISMGLTLLSGLIPSRSAAKKDPVVALRTE